MMMWLMLPLDSMIQTRLQATLSLLFPSPRQRMLGFLTSSCQKEEEAAASAPSLCASFSRYALAAVPPSWLAPCLSCTRLPRDFYQAPQRMACSTRDCCRHTTLTPHSVPARVRLRQR